MLLHNCWLAHKPRRATKYQQYKIFCFIFILLLGWNYYLSMTQQQYSRRSSFCYCSVQQKPLLTEKKPKSPDITSRLLSFWMFQQFVFLCSYDLYLWKSVFFSGCKSTQKTEMNQNSTHLFAEKRRKRFQISAPEFSGFSIQTYRFLRSKIPISAP